MASLLTQCCKLFQMAKHFFFMRLVRPFLPVKAGWFVAVFSVSSLIMRSLILPLTIISLNVLFFASGDILENLEFTFL